MRHTFKASFERQSDAQHLKEELSAAGFTSAELALSGATHAGPFTRSRPAVTLMVDTEPEAIRALGVIERCKPARLQDDQAEEAPDAAGIETPAARPHTGRTTPAYPPGAEPGALQFRHLDDVHYFGTHDTNVPSTGTTYREPMETAAQWDIADEYTIQQTAAALWPDIDVGDNDRERTAFRFGRIMRMDDRYRNRSWDEAEAALKLEWASFAQVASPWDDAKASVRRGWDRTTPEIDDDNHYRSHWTTSYVHGDDATPTTMDDSEARRSEAYRSHDSGEREGDTEHAGAHHGVSAAWQRVREALRHGWDRNKS